jgi:hypothetical protein
MRKSRRDEHFNSKDVEMCTRDELHRYQRTSLIGKSFSFHLKSSGIDKWKRLLLHCWILREGPSTRARRHLYGGDVNSGLSSTQVFHAWSQRHIDANSKTYGSTIENSWY